MKNLSLITLVILISLNSAQAQLWQSEYNEAIQAYQSGDLETAFSVAKQALKSTAVLTDDKNTSLLYTYQILSVITLELEVYDQALDYCTKEIALIKSSVGKENIQYFGALNKSAQALFYLNDVENAKLQYEEAIKIAPRFLAEDDPAWLTLKATFGQLLAYTSDWSKANEILTGSLPYLSKNPELAEEYIFSLYFLGRACFEMKQMDRAKTYLSQFRENLAANELQEMDEYVVAGQLLESINIELGTIEELELTSDGNLTSLLKLAIDEQKDANHIKALSAYQQAAEKASTAELNSKTAFSVFFNQANYLHSQARFQEANTAYLQAEVRAESIFNNYAAELAMLQILNGKIANSLKEDERAAQAYSTAFDIALGVGGEETYISLQSGLFYFVSQNELPTAWKMMVRVWENELYIGSLNSTQQLAFSNLLVDLADLNAKSIEALVLFEFKELSIVEKLTLDEQSKLALSKARLIKQSGDYKRALLIISQQIEKIDASNPILGEAYLQKANVNQRLANYTEAENDYQLAIDLLEKHKVNQEALSIAWNAKATFLMDLGNYEAAEILLKKLQKSTNSASVLQNLAAIYQLTGKYKEAIALLNQSLQLDAKMYGENHPNYALSLQNLAVAYKQIDELEKSIQLFQKAIEIDRINGLGNTESFANKLGNLAMSLQEKGDLIEAEKYLKEALKLRENQLGDKHPDYAFNLYGLGVLYQRKGELPTAASYFNSAIEIYLHQIKSVFPILSEKEKTAFYDKISEVIEAYQDFAIEYAAIHPAIVADLFEVRLVTKGLLLNSTSGVRQRILQGEDEALKADFMKWIYMKEQLAQLYSSSKQTILDNTSLINELESNANVMEKALSVNSVAFASAFEAKDIGLTEIKGKLKNDEAVVEIIRHKLNIKNDSVIYAALILKKNQQYPQLVILDNGNELDNKEYKRYINSIKYKLNNSTSYSKYWASIESYLGEIKKVYLSPDGVFNKININTLYDSETKQYLIEKVNISLITNPKSILEKESIIKLSNSNPIALFGNPEFGGEDVKIDYKSISSQVVSERSGDMAVRGGVNPLPGTKLEIEKISELLTEQKKSFDVKLEGNASEKALKEVNNPEVLHIATHGFFITADKEKGITPMEGKLNNPLLRSGLMLSGIEKYFKERIDNPDINQPEDGLLTAYEAMNLDLTNTQLVVLSACETGSGDLKDGEGVYGLQRSFLVSGASNLVMSLWKVDDMATQELMVKFYDNWLRSTDFSAALRNAQLSIKESYPHPYYWGGFVITR